MRLSCEKNASQMKLAKTGLSWWENIHDLFFQSKQSHCIQHIIASQWHIQSYSWIFVQLLGIILCNHLWNLRWSVESNNQESHTVWSYGTPQQTWAYCMLRHFLSVSGTQQLQSWGPHRQTSPGGVPLWMLPWKCTIPGWARYGCWVWGCWVFMKDEHPCGHLLLHI